MVIPINENYYLRGSWMYYHNNLKNKSIYLKKFFPNQRHAHN